VSGSLSGIGLPQLQHLLSLVSSGAIEPPLRASALQANGLGGCWTHVAWLAALDRTGLEAVLRVALSERAARPDSRVELVWTGPEAKVSAARDTAVVLRDLFGRAQQSVIVAGFAFTSGAQIFRPLFEAMRDRGVEASLFLHVDDLPGLSPEECARRGAADFLRDNWPFRGPVPTIYYDPRTVTPGSSINLHAKCVVIDSRWALVGSANFTHNAHARNIEAGVLIDDSGFATALVQQWQGLIAARLVLSLTQS
jgi:phosphatidylserine/phosphatidylglycerophosphate/cardiolipin synthase-like enzyme